MLTEINPNRIYNADEARSFLGGIGATKLSDYMKLGLITPIRRRPTKFTGIEIINAMERITDYNRQNKPVTKFSDYGID